MTRKSIAWWCWFATAALLSVALLAWPWMMAAVIAVAAAQLIGFALVLKDPRAFPVQVRAGYLALLLIGAWPPLQFVHWIQFVGTWAVVTVDYCLLARILSLAPWNREGPLTGRLVVRTFLSA